jgi:hypothetical protein
VFEVPVRALGTRPVFGPDGRQLAGAVKLAITDEFAFVRQGVQVWDAKPGKEQLTIVDNGATATPGWSPDGSRLVIGQRTLAGVGMLKVHDTTTGKVLMSVEDEAGRAGNRGMTAPTFTPDGRGIAAHLSVGSRAPGGGSEVRVWDAATGKELLALKSGGSESSELTFSRDGYRLIEAGFAPTNFSRCATSRNITMTVWDATPRIGGTAPLSEVTRLMAAADRGDKQTAAALLPLVYDELRRFAASKLGGERPGQTLDATALVQEAYLKLVGARRSLAAVTSSRPRPGRCGAS